MSRRRRTAPTGDRGTTLAELTIAMVVFGVFGTFLATTVLQTTRLARDTAVRETSAQVASTAMAQLTKDLRTALRIGPSNAAQVAFVVARDTEVVFVSSVEPQPVQERLALQSGAVVRQTAPPTGGAYPALTYPLPAAMTGGRALAPGHTTDLRLSYSVSGVPTVQSAVLPADLKDITAVHVRLSVDRDGAGGLPPVVLESTVRPFNR